MNKIERVATEGWPEGAATGEDYREDRVEKILSREEATEKLIEKYASRFRIHFHGDEHENAETLRSFVADLRKLEEL